MTITITKISHILNSINYHNKLWNSTITSYFLSIVTFRPNRFQGFSNATHLWKREAMVRIHCVEGLVASLWALRNWMTLVSSNFIKWLIPQWIYSSEAYPGLAPNRTKWITGMPLKDTSSFLVLPSGFFLSFFCLAALNEQFFPSSPFPHDVLPHLRFIALELADHELKPPEPWAKLIHPSFKLFMSGIMSYRWKDDKHTRQPDPRSFKLLHSTISLVGKVSLIREFYSFLSLLAKNLIFLCMNPP